MKTTTKVAAALVAVAGIAGVGLAAQADSRWQERHGGSSHHMQQAYGGHDGGRGFHEGRRHGGGRHMMRMMDSFDADGDGRLSQEEIDKAREERFSGFDADGNQSLSLTEYEKLWLDAMRETMVDRFQKLDADGDAQVTAEEFKRPYAKMVRRMDHNDDGMIDRDDFQRRRPHGDQKRDGDDG